MYGFNCRNLWRQTTASLLAVATVEGPGILLLDLKDGRFFVVCMSSLVSETISNDRINKYGFISFIGFFEKYKYF